MEASTPRWRANPVRRWTGSPPISRRTRRTPRRSATSPPTGASRFLVGPSGSNSVRAQLHLPTALIRRRALEASCPPRSSFLWERGSPPSRRTLTISTQRRTSWSTCVGRPRRILTRSFLSFSVPLRVPAPQATRRSPLPSPLRSDRTNSGTSTSSAPTPTSVSAVWRSSTASPRPTPTWSSLR